MQSKQHSTEHACMSNYQNRVIRDASLRRQKLHFPDHPPLKVAETLAAGRRQIRIPRAPSASIVLVSLFNLFPAKPFPAAEINLTQSRTHITVNTKRRGERASGRIGASQVARVNRREIFISKSIDKFAPDLGHVRSVQDQSGHKKFRPSRPPHGE